MFVLFKSSQSTYSNLIIASYTDKDASRREFNQLGYAYSYAQVKLAEQRNWNQVKMSIQGSYVRASGY